MCIDLNSKNCKFFHDQIMVASEIVICQVSVLFGQNYWHGPRITWTKNCSAPKFCRSLSSLPPLMKMPGVKVDFQSAGFSSSDRKCVRKRGVQVLSPDMVTPSMPLELLDAWNDEYNGVVIEPTRLPSTANAFASVLRASLSYWKSKGKKGIWLKLFEEQADLVPIAIQEGFVYHHAEPGYVMLTYWIPDEPCLLPSGPSHQIGVAGFVINENKEILVVKEKCSCSCCGVWKLPTGFINKSEELFSGAIREVKEETGIDTEFLELVAFRHVHGVAFEKSDMLFVCMLKPLSLKIQIDEDEIQDAKWITADELLGQEFYEEDQMSKRAIEICMATYEKNYGGFVAHQVISKFDGKHSYLYYKDVNALV